MRLYQSAGNYWLEKDGAFAMLDGFSLDAWLAEPSPVESLLARSARLAFIPNELSPQKPIGSQEVWACGVTYKRSEEARIEESDFSARAYAHVYKAPRPEIFFKATPRRVVGHGEPMFLRHDAKWSVPEPELVLVVASNGKIVGYTVGDDLSSRDIEGENLLYLPQAKVWDTCCSLGPAILLAEPFIDPELFTIELDIRRGGNSAFSGKAEVSDMRRKLDELVRYVFMDQNFPEGVFIMTGTGVVPPADFTLQSGDEVRIGIESIGTLENRIADRPAR